MEEQQTSPKQSLGEIVKGRIDMVIAIICFLAVPYLLFIIPASYILSLPPATKLPSEMKYHPLDVQVQKLSSVQSGVLFRVSGFSSDQITNEPFPDVITGKAPGENPESPKARIRYSGSEDGSQINLEDAIAQIAVMILVIGGTVLFPIIAIAIAYESFKVLIGWQKAGGVLIWIMLIILFIGSYFVQFTGPNKVKELFFQHQPMKVISAGSLLGVYLGVSNEPDLFVINGTDSAVDFYVDGSRVDEIPSRGIRQFNNLRDYSRLTSINSTTHSIVDDINIRETTEKSGFLIYNVRRAATFSVENPPHYD